MVRRTTSSEAPKRAGSPPQDIVLATYMRDVARYPLMTPDEERTRAESIVALRGSYWRHILSYAPYTQAVLDFLAAECKDADKIVTEIATLRAASVTLKLQRSMAKIHAHDAAVGVLSGCLAMLDANCILADRVASELEMLGQGHSQRVSLKVQKPRKGSNPFAALLAAIRGASMAHTTERNRFAKANLRIVVSIAKKYHPNASGFSIGDLIQEGNLGLLKAVDRFDPTRGFRFTTYGSWWIRHYMRRAFANCGRAIRLPQHIHTLATQVSQARGELRGRLGRDPTESEIAESVHISPRKLAQLREALATQPLSLDAAFSQYDRPVDDLISDPVEHEPGSDIDRRRATSRLHCEIQKLDPRARDILRQRFGLDGESRTLAEIGEEYSLSRERIRQLQVEACEHLRERLGPQV